MRYRSRASGRFDAAFARTARDRGRQLLRDASNGYLEIASDFCIANLRIKRSHTGNRNDLHSALEWSRGKQQVLGELIREHDRFQCPQGKHLNPNPAIAKPEVYASSSADCHAWPQTATCPARTKNATSCQHSQHVSTDLCFAVSGSIRGGASQEVPEFRKRLSERMQGAIRRGETTSWVGPSRGIAIKSTDSGVSECDSPKPETPGVPVHRWLIVWQAEKVESALGQSFRSRSFSTSDSPVSNRGSIIANRACH